MKIIKFLLIMVLICISLTAVAKTKHQNQAAAPQQKLCSDYACINQQMDKLKNLAWEKTELRNGNFITYKDTMSMSSGNFLADGIFGAGSVYNVYYSAKIENINRDENKIIVTIADGKLERVKDSAYNYNSFVRLVNEQRSKMKTMNISSMVNLTLWDKFEKNQITKKDLPNTLVLLDIAGSVEELDTVAQIAAKLGYPRFGVAVYEVAMNNLKDQQDKRDDYAARRTSMMSKYNLGNSDTNSTDWIKALADEIAHMSASIS